MLFVVMCLVSVILEVRIVAGFWNQQPIFPVLSPCSKLYHDELVGRAKEEAHRAEKKVSAMLGKEIGGLKGRGRRREGRATAEVPCF